VCRVEQKEFSVVDRLSLRDSARGVPLELRCNRSAGVVKLGLGIPQLGPRIEMLSGEHEGEGPRGREGEEITGGRLLTYEL